ncbi:Cyclin-L1 [Boothiomyces sp. JEL0866]|nr:Cyclin-L1 [Boothiomyces sp. JEL0866]
MENTVITLEQLEHTPSYKHGYSPKLERDIRILCCRFIESATILLRLPQITAATAQVLLHRFFFVESIGSLPLMNVIGGCMYLASKLEESPRRLREILTVLDYLYKRSENMPDSPLDISHPSYYDKRDGLLKAEIHILAKLSFNVHVEHPHGFMMNYLSSLGLSDHPRIPQLALNYLNDR